MLQVKPQKEKKPLYKAETWQAAIEALELSSKAYKVRFEISFLSLQKNPSRMNDNWKIKVMTKIFYDRDFIQAARSAIDFVLTAHTGKTYIKKK